MSAQSGGQEDGYNTEPVFGARDTRVLKPRSQGACSHLVPGKEAVIRHSTKFEVAHFKLAEVPKATSLQGTQEDGEMEEAMRWLIDQFMKVALSPAFYGHPIDP